MHGDANQVNITNPNAFRPANNEVRVIAWAGHIFMYLRRFYLTLIGKSWKTHPENFPKFQFPGHELD